MTLREYYGKTVEIVVENGEEFFGVVEDCFFPDDSERGQESIVIKIPEGYLIEFTPNEIETIETV